MGMPEIKRFPCTLRVLGLPGGAREAKYLRTTRAGRAQSEDLQPILLRFQQGEPQAELLALLGVHSAFKHAFLDAMAVAQQQE